jgi:hypothetical protein
MSRRELRAWLSRLMPYVKGKTQKFALFAVLLILGAANPFDAPHLHVEPAPIEPSVSSVSMYTNTTSHDMPMINVSWDTAWDKKSS